VEALVIELALGESIALLERDAEHLVPMDTHLGLGLGIMHFRKFAMKNEKPTAQKRYCACKEW